MANVRVKRGAKQHYIHKSDKLPRPVHLGTDPHSARKRLIKLKNSHTKKQAKLDADIEKLQHKLKKVAEHGKPHSHKLAEVKQTYYKQKMYDKMVAEGRPKNRTEQIAILATLVVCSIIFLGYLLGAPMITGSAIVTADIDAKSIANDNFTSTMMVFIAVIGIMLTLIHLKFHLRHKKHADYRP